MYTIESSPFATIVNYLYSTDFLMHRCNTQQHQYIAIQTILYIHRKCILE